MNSDPQQPEPPTFSGREFHHVAPGPVFFGRFGLRAGYGIVLWLAVFALATSLGSTLALSVTGHLREVAAMRAYVQAHPNAPAPTLPFDFTPLFVVANDGVWFLVLFVACWLFARVEHRPLRAYGIGSYRIADLLRGAFWGLAVMSALIATLHFGGLLVFDSCTLHGVAVFVYGLKWLLAFLLVGLAEEYTFRGYLQYTLLRGLWGAAEMVLPSNPRLVAFWASALILSSCFAFVHTGNGGETAFGIAQVFLAGIVFAYALWRTGSLWWAIGFHATWDWAQSFLFGVRDSGTLSAGRLFNTHPMGRTLLSGGSTGPEGSIFATVALLLTLVILRFTPPGTQPVLEPQPTSGSTMPSLKIDLQ